MRFRELAPVVLATLSLVPPGRAEVVEEIVAWVNGEIITRSEFENEEEMMLAEAYRRYTGEDLDERVKALRESLLQDMLDRKMLLDRARVIFSDLTQIKDYYFRSFKESQNVKDDAELSRMLEAEGMTVEQFKTRLLELYAPDEVLRMEVRERVSVSDTEVEEHYRNHPDAFAVPIDLTIREIVLLAGNPEERARRRGEAESLVAELRAGADFGETAQRISEAGTKDDGGLLGPVTKGDLAKPLEAVALELPVGQVSDIVETTHGLHILKVESRTGGNQKPLEEVREQVRTYLEEQKYMVARATFLQKIRDEAEWCVKKKFQERIAPEAIRMMQCPDRDS